MITKITCQALILASSNGAQLTTATECTFEILREMIPC